MNKSILLFACLILPAYLFSQDYNFTLRSKVSYPNDLSNLWGYTDVDTNEYALVGWFKGVSIVDVSNPDSAKVLHNVPGPDNIWREIRTFQHYAYVTNEGDSGLQVIDLQFLPDSVHYHWIKPLGMTKSHTVFIDENGIAYVNGPNVGVGGIIFLDLNADPWNPPVLGNYNRFYVHDCIARGDTLYAAHINDGFFTIVDVSDKTQTNLPAKTLAQQRTSLDFTHNVALSDDGKFLYATDEKPNSYLDAFDISNLAAIKKVDRIQSSPGTDVIIHNTYWLNNYAVTSYYTDGVTIHDVSRPNNLIQVGWYDSSPFSGDGFNGAWGVYPFFNSGTVIVSDIEEGLFVLSPKYKRACYLEGVVTDSLSTSPINTALVSFTTIPISDESDFTGNYKTGYRDSGNYTIQFSKAGYVSRTFSNIRLNHGAVTTLNVALIPVARFNLTGIIKDSTTGNPIQGALVQARSKSGDLWLDTTNALGVYTFLNAYPDIYELTAGIWGHHTVQVRDSFDIFKPGKNIDLPKGYRDEFALNLGWTNTATASSGLWQRVIPIVTFASAGVPCNPDQDIATDIDSLAFVSGNSASGSPGDEDVDNGDVILRSPVFSVLGMNKPHLSVNWWFCNAGGSGAPNDTLRISLRDSTKTKSILLATRTSSLSQWNFLDVPIKNYFPESNNLRLEIICGDAAPGHLVEGGIDLFNVYDSLPSMANSIVNIQSNQPLIYPNPSYVGFNIKLPNNEPHTQVSIIESGGKLVKSFEGKPNETYGSNLPSGIYLIEVRSEKQTHTIRWIKQGVE